MKFAIAKEQLLSGVQSVIKGVSAKNTLPILQGIHVKAENNQIIFTASDLKYTVQCKVTATVEENGQVVIPARLFNELVKKLPEVQIQVSTTEDMIIFNYFFSEASLKTMAANEFPKVEELKAEPIRMPASTLKQMIRQTGIATADDKLAETRPVFGGVLFELKDGVLNVVATDTHRLAYKHTSVSTEVNISVIIPGYAVNEILRLLKDNDETVDVILNKNFAGFKFGSITMLSRLVEGSYPPYSKVIPSSYSTKVKVTTKTFADALDRASLLSKRESNIVKFKVLSEKKSLVLMATGENGKVSESVPLLETEGPDIEVNFNAKFMADALRVSDSEEIHLEFGSSSNAPGVVHPIGDESYLYLALPVRVA